ncbi:MAG: DUF2798 domain-containing protein [Sphingobacteriales bacterium]|nr:MAG: DUF2798 domain-containing protein [Sphingobacteriales bacterium]
MKQKVLFAVLMGVITTGVVSFTLISVNFGFTPGFLAAWLKSWLLAYLTAVPVILLLSASVQQLVTYLTRQSSKDHQEV